MTSRDYWQIFLETGAPEMYLLYNKALKMETSYVPDNTGAGTADHSLQ